MTGAPSLSIDTLPLPQGKGALGLTHCPGSCQSEGSAGLPRPDLAMDLASIRAWGATVLVTLIEPHEFAQMRVEYLGEMAEAEGLEWHHLPIPDMDVPDWRFGTRWFYSGLRLRRLLRQGGRVVLHCKAGLGRAGTIAAHLLVELGMPPAEAVSQVRRARPGAIQTRAQEEHVQRVTKVSALQDELMARRLACVLGGALGDGFAYPVEYDKLAAIRRRFGDGGLRAPQYEHGQMVASSATQLTLFTLEGLIRAHLRKKTEDDDLIRHVRTSYMDWLETQGGKALGNEASRLMKHAAMHVRRTQGKTWKAALEAGGQGSPEAPINDSKDSGGVVRIAPVALMPNMDASRAFNLGLRAAALTHGHPRAYLPAGILAAALYLLLAGRTTAEAFQQARQLAQGHAGSGDTIARLDTALEAARRHHLAFLPAHLGPGWAGDEALAIGLYAASCSLDFAKVMATAANQDGDSTAAAAIAGQLHGALFGLEHLPHAWIRRLDVLDPLCDVMEWGQELWTGPAAT
jgi:ADP-ribosylglycohydrolase/protein-tyrosine phosphatase